MREWFHYASAAVLLSNPPPVPPETIPAIPKKPKRGPKRRGRSRMVSDGHFSRDEKPDRQ
jgi:hypothetical protein